MSDGLAISLKDLKAVSIGSDLVVDASPAEASATPVVVVDPSPAKAVRAQGKVKLRLSDGTVRERGQGRMPLGSVVLNDAGVAITEPLQSKAKARVRLPSYIRLSNGEVVAWVRGRHPAGSVKCDASGNVL